MRMSIPPGEYFVEGKYYARNSIANAFGGDTIIDELFERGICQAHPDNRQIVFRYVGLIAIEKYTVFILPKYMSVNGGAAGIQLSNIIRVMKKYSQSAAAVYGDSRYLARDTQGNNVSIIAIADYLLEDYFTHGLYRKSQNRRRVNLSGEIHWDKTIRSSVAYIAGEYPIYLDTYTTTKTTNTGYIVSQLHKLAIQVCMSEFALLLGYTPVSLDHEMVPDINEIPQANRIISVIQQELNLAYSNRSIILLKSLLAWFGEKLKHRTKQLLLYGTRRFEYIWQAVCSELFKNEIADWQGQIPKPIWWYNGQVAYEADTFIPDIIRVCQLADGVHFLLLDAKYYDLLISANHVSGNPGVNDVAKQLFYETVIRQSPNYDIDWLLHNAFLFPSEDMNLFFVPGKVSLSGLNAGPVAIVFISANTAYNRYLTNQPLSTDEVSECIQKINAAI